MNELASILRTWRSGEVDLTDAVLATVVGVRGSAYRRPGARMLILADGTRVGTISGGCLEAEVARKAAWWTSRGEPGLRTFDTSSEHAAWEFGLGCNGVITLLLERLNHPAVTEQLGFLERELAARREAIVATVIRDPSRLFEPGARLLWSESGVAGGSLRDTSVEPWLAAEAGRAITTRASRHVHLDGLEVFVERVAPVQRLVVFGAGHDAIPLVAMATLLGWSTTVADPRAAYARLERFPGADRVVTLPRSGDLAGIDIDPATAVVMMTHNYPQDVTLLPRVLERAPGYLGLLGPRSRTERLYAETGLGEPDDRVHAPVGLDIGSDHPETIALAIVAEIQAVLSRRNAGFLRDRSGPIHDPGGESAGRRESDRRRKEPELACAYG